VVGIHQRFSVNASKAGIHQPLTKTLAAAAAILLSLGAPVSAHRLDEYLQATIISVEKDRLQALMRLAPCCGVFVGDCEHRYQRESGCALVVAERAHSSVSALSSSAAARCGKLDASPNVCKNCAALLSVSSTSNEVLTKHR